MPHTPGRLELDKRVRCLALVSPALVASPGLGPDYPGVVAFWSGPSSTPGNLSGEWADKQREQVTANAARLAACWNAMEGVDDPAVVPEIVRAAAFATADDAHNVGCAFLHSSTLVCTCGMDALRSALSRVAR